MERRFKAIAFAAQAPDFATLAAPAPLCSATVAALILVAACASQAQTMPPATPQAPPVNTVTIQAQQPRESERRRAAKLYLAASKLFMDEHFEEAMQNYEEAAKLDSTNSNYRLAADVARSHAVTALTQSAAKDRLRGDEAGARAALGHALELDPRSVEATQHLYELGFGAGGSQSQPIYEQASDSMGETPLLAPTPGRHSFHLRTGQRQILEQVFKATPHRTKAYSPHRPGWTSTMRVSMRPCEQLPLSPTAFTFPSMRTACWWRVTPGQIVRSSPAWRWRPSIFPA
jgi:tetratricopeptide (TPR) repeat protein